MSEIEVTPGVQRQLTATDAEVIRCDSWKQARKLGLESSGSGEWLTTYVVAIDGDGRPHNAHPFLEGPAGGEWVIWHCTCGARSTGRYGGAADAIAAAELEHPIGRIPWERI